MIKKADIFLIVFLIVFAFSFVFIFGSSKNAGGTAMIKLNGEIYGEYNLFKNQTIEITKNNIVTNTAVINNGKIKMISANCPDQYCVNQKAINETSKTIVCLPNLVVIEVINGQETEIDSISQ